MAYDGYETSKQIIMDCEQALANWTFDTAAVKPALSIKSRTEEGYDDEQLQSGEWAAAEEAAEAEAEAEVIAEKLDVPKENVVVI